MTTDQEWEDSRVFSIDEGFGNTRLTVRVFEGSEKFGDGVTLFDTDRDLHLSIEFDVWDRVVKAVARRREG